MTDTRGAKVLLSDAEHYQTAWMCPRRKGGRIAPDELTPDTQAALERVRRLTRCSADDLRTCPGYYVRLPEAEEAVRLLRWLRAGALPLRLPHPSGAQIDALDELQSALGAREADDLERLKAQYKDPRGQ